MQVMIISNQIIVIVITKAQEQELVSRYFNIFKIEILFNNQNFHFSLWVFPGAFLERKERIERKLWWKKEGATWIIHSNSVMWMPIVEKYYPFNNFSKTCTYIYIQLLQCLESHTQLLFYCVTMKTIIVLVLVLKFI